MHSKQLSAHCKQQFPLYAKNAVELLTSSLADTGLRMEPTKLLTWNKETSRN